MAKDWANSASTYLTGDSHWTHVTSPKRGDIVGYIDEDQKYHVGIVIEPGTTISVRHEEVVSNDWGFVKGHSPTFWRYSP